MDDKTKLVKVEQLSYVKEKLDGKVDVEQGKGLSTNDYTDNDKNKLTSIDEGAQENTIESISMNGTPLQPDANKNVALVVMTNAVNNLVNYYLKTETYSKSEVDSIVTAIKNSRFEVVSQLPTSDIKTNVIYLVPKAQAQTNNVRDEYINLDGTSSGWEKIGDTEIDLSNYVTTTALNTALANYATAATVNAINTRLQTAETKLSGIEEGAKDNVIFANYSSDFPAEGDTSKVYVERATNTTYRWNGNAYVKLGLQLGRTASTAYNGRDGYTAYEHSQITDGNPHNVTKSDVGLGNVNNTSDLNKPVSNATQEALGLKAAAIDISASDGSNLTVIGRLTYLESQLGESTSSIGSMYIEDEDYLFEGEFKYIYTKQSASNQNLILTDCSNLTTHIFDIEAGSVSNHIVLSDANSVASSIKDAKSFLINQIGNRLNLLYLPKSITQDGITISNYFDIDNPSNIALYITATGAAETTFELPISDNMLSYYAAGGNYWLGMTAEIEDYDDVDFELKVICENGTTKTWSVGSSSFAVVNSKPVKCELTISTRAATSTPLPFLPILTHITQYSSSGIRINGSRIYATLADGPILYPYMDPTDLQKIMDKLEPFANKIGAFLPSTPIYGFKIDDSISDSYNAVTYLADAVGMTPAHMDYQNDTFDYGSWENAWFVKDCKPCLLGQDGTVISYLDKDDFSKDIQGNDVDIETPTNANVMIEFPKIYYKQTENGEVYIAKSKVNDEFKDFAYIDYQGNHKEHFYMPAYNSSIVDGVMRSVSNAQASKSLTAEQEITAATANGNGWYTEDFGEITLINYLLILMGKSLDTQGVFGQGITGGGSESFNDGFRTGVHNTKGMFYGKSTNNAYTDCVKVFGIENYWGFQWRRYAGHINDNGINKVKLCYGREDGSTVDSFNLDGTGYLVGSSLPSTSGDYISKMKFENYSMTPVEANGSETTYYRDGLWTNNGQQNYVLRGGVSWDGARCGAFYCALGEARWAAWWGDAAAVSYK